MPPSQPQPFTNERSLFEAAERLSKYRQGKIAVMLHLSKLQQHRRAAQYLRIAIDTFENQVRPLGGQLFVLSNSDVVLITEGKDLLQIEAAVNRQRVLFQEDPLVQFAGQAGYEDGLSTWYRLDLDYDNFMATCQKIFAQAERARSLLLQEQQIKDSVKQLQPVDPAVLGKLEQAINKADLSTLIRRQTACTVIEGQPLMPLFEEFFVAIAELQQSVCPGFDLYANNWLFQYLTAALDHRMIAHLLKDARIRSGDPFSLNMHVQTLLSPTFQRFDAAIPSTIRGKLVIEVHIVDVFADLGAFIFARDYLQERGYRICLDGITHLTLRYVDRARLGADLVKLYWTPEGVNTLEKNMLNHFKSLVMQTGQARTVLCRTEDEFALEFGRAAGIIMFQGRYIERLLSRQRDQQKAGIVQPVPLNNGLVAEKTAAPTLTATRV